MYLKKALRGTALVFVISSLAAVCSYLFRILLARNLEVDQYGLFFAMLAFFASFTLLTDLGLNQAIPKFLVEFRVKGMLITAKSLLIYFFLFQLGISLIIFLGMIASSELLMFKFFKSDDTMPFILMAFWFLTIPIVSFFGNSSLGFQKPGINSSVELFRQGASLVLTALFIYFNFGSRSPFLAYACLNILLLITYSRFIHVIFPGFFKTKIQFELKVFCKIFKYGIFLTLTSLLTTIFIQSETLFLTYFNGTEAVGYYQIAIPLVNLAFFLIPVINTVSYPIISELYTRNKKRLLSMGISLIYSTIWVVVLPIIIVLITFPQELITLLFGEKYLAASFTLQILAFGGLFSMIASLNSAIFAATGHAKTSFRIMIIATVLNVLLDFLIIPKYSYEGAAVVSTTSFFIAMILTLVKIKKLVKVQIPLGKWALTSSVSIAIAAAGYFMKISFGFHPYIELILISGVMVILYAAVIFAFRVLTIEEIKGYIRTFLGK